MHRLFVGLRPPSAIREQLLDLTDGVENARWQDDDQLHLTLRFVGELEARQADDLAQELERVTMMPFPLALRGVGHFERKGAPSILWVGVAPSEPVAVLQGRVEQACRRAGLEPERRKFAPHVTLARLNRSAGPVGAWLARHGTFASGAWTVERITLFESYLTPLGSEYQQAVSYRLRD
jgi:2'-5' RNA ligase